RLPCVSCLSWTTNQHRAWAREAEQIPGLRPFPRVKLLLIGWLCRGRGPDLSLKDATGELSCQVPKPPHFKVLCPPPLCHPDTSCRLWWSRSVHVGMSVHVTQLRACTLRSWNRNSVLSATGQSELTVHPADQSQPSVTSVFCTQDVLSRGAGLYVIDRKVGLCLANQPLPLRAIRPGDTLQISNVHVLRRPSPDHAPIMLCCCLRSSVTVTAFSPGYRGDEEESCPGDGVLLRLLLHKDVGVAMYLWMCHVTTCLRDRLVLVQSWFRPGSGLVQAWSSPGLILETVTGPRKSRRRDIYGEMMDTPHTCCLVCVRHFTMVTERFIQSEFPSFRHLDQEHFISLSLSLCRIYLQFSLDQVTVLSPSVSMAIQLRQGAGPGSDASGEELEPEERKRKRRRDEEATACVSVVIRVEQKEGVALRNVEAGRTLSFNLKTAVIGPVVCWGRDPKNHPITEREVTPGENKVQDLTPLFVVWFWRELESLTGARTLHIQVRCPPILLVCQMPSLYIRCPPSLHQMPFLWTGVRLTVCDHSGRSLQVYLELSHAPFSPGLLPGNTLSFSRVQRKCHTDYIVQKSAALVCSSTPTPPPFPIMLLGQWGEGSEVNVARVKGHLVCVMFLQLQWTCSKCLLCFSRAVVLSAAPPRLVVLEDGTAEAHVCFYNPLVRALLRLDDSQWAGLQRALKVKGHIQVQPRGRSMSVVSLCPPFCSSAPLLCSSASLRMVRGDRDFVTKMRPPLQLTCVHLERDGPMRREGRTTETRGTDQ
uniref:CST complex subunit CTC1 n=1 Tax=Periophthalmus magnuspinnatus TaxID=409849 RepID=A0A3B4BHF4_9GOBI